jgi:predicted ATPase
MAKGSIMITRIEIDGFKSFHNFAVDLQPFTVLIGGNGTGKSNLFDAIRFLAALAEGKTVREAFVEVGRGDPREMFALQADGTRAERMRFAVEMKLNKKVPDDFGQLKLLDNTEARYEIELVWNAGTAKDYLPAFIDVELLYFYDVDSKHIPVIEMNDDGFDIIGEIQGENKKRTIRTTYGDVWRSIISRADDNRTANALAARREMQSWRTLFLEPAPLREPSYNDAVAQLKPSGANLAATLQRLSQQDERALHNISLELANTVDGLREIKVQPLPPDKYEIKVITRDGAELSTRMLSDGTLRFIAYLALKYDREHRGVMCIEEPENDVHPKQLERIVRILRAIATDFHSDAADQPLRQVIITTHSTALMSMVPLESLVYMRATPEGTKAAYVVANAPTNLDELSNRVYTIDVVRQLLDNETPAEQKRNLEAYRQEITAPFRPQPEPAP